MSRQGQTITLSVSEGDKAELEALSLKFGMNWGEKPNISKLIKAIASRELRLAANHDWSPERIQALDAARKTLIDSGKIPEALEIAKLLTERSELDPAFRQEIENFWQHPQPAWREKIESFIQQQQPFRLTYRDAAERQWVYTVLHARIVFIEKREYLACYAEESQGNQDIEALSHNWTLRIDRITEAAVVALDAADSDRAWLPDFARVPVEFHLLGGLAFAYEPKPDDGVGELEGEPPFRRVVRDISSSFWFFREIAAYWDECAIISPPEIRDRFQDKVQGLGQRYSLGSQGAELGL